MGKSTKLIDDSNLHRAHDAGAKVVPIQVLAHSKFGTIAYQWPRHWVFHGRSAGAARDDLTRLHKRVLKLPVDNTDMRSIYDMAFLQDIYATGCRMVVESILAIQHFCEEIERCTKSVPSEGDLIERLDAALKAAQLNISKKTKGYASLIELLKIRNAIEHPKPENTYSGDSNNWDRVPLAWFISDRSINNFDSFYNFLNGLNKRWTLRLEKIKKEDGPSTLHLSQRGVRSIRQFKKPTNRHKML